MDKYSVTKIIVNLMKGKINLIFAVAIQLLFPKVNTAQTPALGSTSTFSIFTAIGDIDILGASTIYGDVGTNVGAYTKSISSTIFGVVHNADPTSAMAATDVASLYSDLSGRTCGAVISGSTSLGTTRKILGPDTVFCLSGAQTLDSILTLDAQGNPNAIFIIQIDGALTTTISSQVLLINSASFCNVFWQVNGAVTLGENSVFNGTIVSNGAISLLDSAALNGRALSEAGAIALDNNMLVGCDAFGFSLPITLVSFTAQNINSKVHLQWSTASQFNNDYFSVQRSPDGIILEDILKVAGAGTTQISHHYEAIDDQPLSGKALYRLKQTDFDGKTHYSNFISLTSTPTDEIRIFPNPFMASLRIKLSNFSQRNNCVLSVFNMLGQPVIKIPIVSANTTIATDFFVPGIYFCTITSDKEIIYSGRITCIR